MTDNYAKLVQDNLNLLYSNLPTNLKIDLPANQEDQTFTFTAFGEKCRITQQGITLGDQEHSSIFGILISLYALNARPDMCITTPFKSFKELPDSMPYVGAFTTHTELGLIPHVEKIKSSIEIIKETLNGDDSPAGTAGDFSFVVYPLPKIALCYVFYEADEDFPASATCLYSNNAHQFLPVDGLADVGEYCSKKIMDIIK